MPNGADLFVSTIAQLGIGQLFTLVGDHLNDVLPAAARAGIRIIDMRHESGVTHAADAWGRLTRKPGLALVSGGPGHTNSITGIATAYAAASPMIAVSGARANAAAHRGSFQDMDQVEMVRPVAKWAAHVNSAAQIPFYLGRAYAEAVSGRMGPVHLTIPMDVFGAACDSPLRAPEPVPRVGALPSSQDVDRAIALLRTARRPVVIAGSGAWWSGAADELRRFIEHTSLPLYTITMARGIVSDEHPLCFGYADPALNKAVRTAFHESDLFLVLGKRFDYRLALGGPRLIPAAAACIQVDIQPQELGMNRKLDVPVCADVKAALSAFTDAAGPKWKPLPWLDRLRQLAQAWEDETAALGQNNSSPMHPAVVYREMKEALPPDVVFSWDGGDFVHWGRAILPAKEPGMWMRLGPLATIGSALPNAIAMRLAMPERPVVLITGDGSLGFYIAEIDTAVRHKLPFVIVVGNDAGWGVERELQGAVTGGETVACELRSTRYDIVTKGFGGDGETIDDPAQIRPALERAFASDVPYCLNVIVKGVRSPFSDWQIAGKKR
jgi:acetolactate synthase-1/2/3 large subunit